MKSGVPLKHNEMNNMEVQHISKLAQGTVIGMPVTIGTVDSLSEHIFSRAGEDTGSYVCVANVHMVTLARRNEDFVNILRAAEVVTSDGMPLVWELHRQGHASARRVTGLDLTLKLLKRCEAENQSVYFYGGRAETKSQIEHFLHTHYPRLNAVVDTPPLLSPNIPLDPDLIRRISQTKARVVFVGLGCPKQERWMARHAPYLKAASVGVGAVFNILAGESKQTPKWMQELGLEWLYRLWQEPRRLWKRYFITNLLYAYYLAVSRIQEVGRKK
jgi:N-acetylglucosaminyldiphosphoundecaprenol N-acetyl-beta-D-mannosaminyltransferase